MLFAGVRFRCVLNGDLQLRIRNRQGAEFFLYNIVFRVNFAPVDGVGILRAARIGDRAVRGDGDLAFIRRNETGDGCIRLRQRRAVIRLLCAAGGDRQLGREDLQTAGTDVQADAVVRILRHVCQC